MKRKFILAHRGWWTAPEEQNSTVALERAIEAGFGIETDIRDRDGELVISHNPPLINIKTPSLSWLLGRCRAHNYDGVLAINIKSDGLAKLVSAQLSEHPDIQTFVFDMSVPDMLGYLEANLSVFSRMSEHETKPACENQSAGIWLDSFGLQFPQGDVLKRLVEEYRSVAVVSPELHGREHRQFWAEIRQTVSLYPDLVSLCTDFPDEAEQFFAELS